MSLTAFDAKAFIRSGHLPTLLASFLYFDFTFAVWVLNGAMAPFISNDFGLSPAETGFMVSVPIIAGALMRLPLGVLAQYVGRKNAAMAEMALIVLALLFGYVFVDTHRGVLAMGVLLGIAGSSFGIALSLGSGWFPAKFKGLAMGIAGAGNSGTVLAVLFAPPLAQRYGWQTVYGLAAAAMVLPLVVMALLAKEPPDHRPQTFRQHIACLFERDAWALSLMYVLTFGGFIGLAAFMPSYFHDQFKVTPVQAGQLTMIATLIGSVTRVIGGHIADRWGGINLLTGVAVVAIFSLLMCSVASEHLAVTTVMLVLCFAALGAGNGAVFQLVPLRWPLGTAVASSLIGEVGALAGALVPNAMGHAKVWFGDYSAGFGAMVALALLALAALRWLEGDWTRSWADRGGVARRQHASSKAAGAG